MIINIYFIFMVCSDCPLKIKDFVVNGFKAKRFPLPVSHFSLPTIFYSLINILCAANFFNALFDRGVLMLYVGVLLFKELVVSTVLGTQRILYKIQKTSSLKCLWTWLTS